MIIENRVNETRPRSGEPANPVSLTCFNGGIAGFAIPAAATSSKRRSDISKDC